MARSNSIDYDAVLQKALRQVVRDILIHTASYGLFKERHYYITFATTHPWVELPEYIKEDYPDQMTIVLQHEFWDLEVTADAFLVTLCFDDINERIKVPFLSLISFVDPSSNFGLQFVQADDFEDDQLIEKSTDNSQANIVILDDFRKK
jgi:hypothetical protein